MKAVLTETPIFGLLLTIFAYSVGARLHKKWPYPIFTPLVFSIITIILILTTFEIDYATFTTGGNLLHLLITPATVSLAITLEKNYRYLKEHYPAILLGIGFGTILHSLIIIGLILLFKLDQSLFPSFFSKSITTAIALSVSDSLGGIEAMTITLVVLTGTLGATIGPYLFKLIHLDDPIAQGVALGSSSHAIGTSKAIELGEVQGAMSGISIVLTGISYVILAPLAQLLNTWVST